ncbi:MAG: hypothetical protein DRI39_08310 [Chloroflexi bacterium]|nr:MAG: hypothetical protein DRI39_08310 [Chloroflexota bacterium]
MEKMIYLVWKHEADSPAGFRQKLLGEVSEKLMGLGVHRLRISVVDDDVAPADPLRIVNSRPPISGLVSMWVDTAIDRKPLEETLENAVARVAGYLVTESEPIVNTRHLVPDGQRTPGMCQVALLQRPPRLAREQWLEIWLGSHTQVAVGLQSTFGYRQNVVVRTLTYAAPPYDAIVEENFPEAAMTDPNVFFDSVGDEARTRERQKQMYQSCARFIDFDKIDVMPTSEYNMKS